MRFEKNNKINAGRKPWNKGVKIDLSKYPKYGNRKKHSEETKLKMSVARKKRITTDITKERMRKAHEKRLKNLPIINCKECGIEMKKKSTTHLYCARCYKTREIKSKYKKLMAKHPERKYARNNAAKLVPLKSSCQICGSTENLHRHHWRYDKPLLVNTLCRTCHEIQHVKNFNRSKFAMEVTA